MRLWKFESLVVLCCLTLVSRAGDSVDTKESKEPKETKESKEKEKRHVFTAITKLHPSSESLKCRQSNGEEGVCLSVATCFQEKLYSAIAGIEPLYWGSVDKCSYAAEGGAVFYGACCTGVQRNVYVTPLLVPILPSNDLPSTSVKLATTGETGVAYVPLTLASGSASWPFGNLPSFQQPGGITWILGPTPPKPASTPQKGSCGTKSMTFRIVGGVPAERHAWRWMAGLFMRNRLFCGGSLIDEYTVLTAAHCVKSVNAHALTIHLGDHDTSSTTETDHITVRASRIIVHPAYNDVNNHNDVALIRLASKVSYTEKVYPICLPSPSETSDFAGQIATVAGWGSLAYGRPTSPILNEVNIRIWNNRDCANAYRGHFPGQIVDSFVCAGQQGQDSCTGDSGGPLMVFQHSRWVQIGVVSWGIGCGSTEYPGVYTRVTSMLKWIRVNQNV